MRYLFLLSFIFLALTASAQKGFSTDTATKDGIKYTYVEKMPEPDYDLGKYLGKSIHYPDFARKNKIEGRVIIKFVVNEDGSISNCLVARGIYKDCDEEALRVVKSMPSWKPAMRDGKPVKASYTMPVVFKLDN